MILVVIVAVAPKADIVLAQRVIFSKFIFLWFSFLQVRHYAESHKLYSELVHAMGDGDEPDDPHSQNIQQKLDRIRALEITVDN